jgi:hypothetical protein
VLATPLWLKYFPLTPSTSGEEAREMAVCAPCSAETRIGEKRLNRNLLPMTINKNVLSWLLYISVLNRGGNCFARNLILRKSQFCCQLGRGFLQIEARSGLKG